jgi:HEAT repeat protein
LYYTGLAAGDAHLAALQDSHPAVRAAAATSLGRIGDGNHVTALRKLGVDPEGPVRHAARASLDKIEHASLDRVATAALSTAVNANRL